MLFDIVNINIPFLFSFFPDYKFLSFTIVTRRRVNRLTDQRILTVFSPGFRIQSKILTDLRILQLQRFAVFIDFFGPGVWILLVIKFGLWISVIVRNIPFCLFLCVCVAVVFVFCFLFLLFLRTKLTECHAVGK